MDQGRKAETRKENLKNLALLKGKKNSVVYFYNLHFKQYSLFKVNKKIRVSPITEERFIVFFFPPKSIRGYRY